MTRANAERLIDSSVSGQRWADAMRLLDLMSEVTGEEPEMTGKTIGFGTYHFRYKTGRQGDFYKIGFTPTKQGLTLYIMSGLRGFGDILGRLGPHTSSKSTVKIKRLGDVDEAVLTELISECVRHIDEVETALGAIPRMSDIPPRTV